MGGQKGIAYFYEYLSRLIPVTVISTKNNEYPIGQQFVFIPLLGNSKLRYINPLLFFKLKNSISKNKSTHLFLEHPYYGWLGILLKIFCNIKLVVHSHNIETQRFKSMGRIWWPILWQYEKYTHRKADINFFITDEDRQFAVQHFKLDAAKCHTITYGFEISKLPLPDEKLQARKQLQQQFRIMENEKILLFNGTLDYKPNLDAVDMILNQINPLLLKNGYFKYKIIICGKGLPARYEALKNHVSENIIYAGFVDDINLFFKGSDIFINPVTDGGGIKTKLVEALGNNLSSVSTTSGAFGVPVNITGEKMLLTDDNNWNEFADAVFNINVQLNTPETFFKHFFWGNIAEKVNQIIA